MLSLAYRLVLMTVGVLLVAVGIVGIFLPVLQGFLLIALGLSVLSMVSERVRRWVRNMKARALVAWRRYRPRKGTS
jgi:uncharacterized membrane protein YbaN (DUF454 family)